MKQLGRFARRKLEYLKQNYKVEVSNDKPGGYIVITVKNELYNQVGDEVIGPQSRDEDTIDEGIRVAERLQPRRRRNIKTFKIGA